ncbi:type II toxin-antitoxin system VapC family toxin [Prevotella sp. AM34-19LB]|uniref:type II toxin-antitoxin system VapC family toxin n=1 Tax=Prevotella sp. AM34-19LB TaxID=2292364 RepID=UPI000E5D2387|nr:type II toxin-antitoxin system VapC family toxin [Prevotella sp. AM34-19LB]
MDDYELLYGAQCSDRPSENIKAVSVFCQYVTILPMVNVWNEFAVQKAFLRKKGQLIEDADIIIGTTAIINNMVMVTENVKHIGRLNGIVVENWMEK